MSNRSQKNFQYVFIGADVATLGLKNPTSLAAGEIGCFTLDGRRITESTTTAGTHLAADEMVAGDPFVIAMRPSNSDNTIVVSPTLYKQTSFKKWNHQAYTAEQEQIDYIGYDGTTAGTQIDAQNLTEYLLSISLQQNVTSNHGGWYTLDAAYTSDAAALQSEIASGIVEPLVNAIKMEADRPILVERICNNAGAATTAGPGGTGDVTCVNGSKYIACNGGQPSTDFAVGDWIRIGTGTGNVIYKVTGVSDVGDGHLTIDIPFQGTTGTTLSASVEVITEALADLADFGIKLTGVQKKFSVGKLHNSKVSWKVSLGNWGTTSYTEYQKAHLGHGTERTVKELEWFTNGFDGEMYRSPEPFVFSQRALASGNYDTINLYCENTQVDVLGLNSTKFVITLMVPATLAVGNSWALAATADDTTDVLEILVTGVAIPSGVFACS